jgi:hypothetical protein
MARRRPHDKYQQPPDDLRPPRNVYEWKRILRRVKARRGRPNSKTANFYPGLAIALDGNEVVVTSAVKHVGTVMSDFADYEDGRNIIRPIEEIANGCDLDRATVMGAIETLRAIGMLWRGFRGSSSGLQNQCSEYQLVIADDLIQRVPLHPPTERNDQVTPTHLDVESIASVTTSDVSNDIHQVTPTPPPGDSDSPAQVTPTHPSYPVTYLPPTHDADTSPATAELEGAEPQARKTQTPVDNLPRIGVPATQPASRVGRCRKCHRYEQRSQLDAAGYCDYCTPSRKVPA